MKIEQAARTLREMYDSAPDREKAVHVHLFGIRYASQLDGISAHEVAERAGLQRSYGAEIRKGMNLAKYVEERRQ